MEETKILIVDDHRVVIEGIKSVLRDHPEFNIVGEAIDGRQALELATSLHPHIVIMDISMTDLNGVDAAKQIKKARPDTQIVIYTMHSNKEFVVELFRQGVSAYVLKDDPLSDLVLALKAVQGRGTYFSTMAPTILLKHMEELEEKIKSQDPYERLSGREREVFALLAEGKRIREIAEKLFISTKTVESHKYNIMKKLETRSMVDLIRIAIRKSLIKA